MKSELSKIEPRKCSEIYRLLKEMVPHYTPEWAGYDKKDAGVALLKIFSRMNETVVNRLNQAPKKNFVAFLDMLGIKLLPAQSSRAPLTFNLAKGVENEILILARTQAAADKTGEHEELPFETEKNLLATPSQLIKVMSLDPSKDAIYESPPDFLNGERKKEPIAYTIVSSPVSGAKNFQLDNVTDLKKGDLLKVGGEDNPEYVIISSISTKIIKIEKGLKFDRPANTPVEKITKFNLFEGLDLQEHSLYIGHKDLFNIKSTAQFTLLVRHRAGTETGVTPLKVSWEYWGEVKGTEGEEWRRFNTIDGTNGLSKSGTIELGKMTEGEIKEKEINGMKSRWIRCFLEEPLPVNVYRKLPVLDDIVFGVRSSGKNLLPDKAFNNDTPFDITKPFTPFGNEPRMFDNFFIASKEVFSKKGTMTEMDTKRKQRCGSENKVSSKKGAKIEMDIEVEKRGVLGPPTAIFYGDKIKIFNRGTYGRLMEVEINPDGTGEKWIDHGFPPETKVAAESTPSAVKYPGDNSSAILSAKAPRKKSIKPKSLIVYDENISVFARAQNGHLVESFFNGKQWLWIDRGIPEKGVNVNFDPIAIYWGAVSVFVTGSDGQLYEFIREQGTMSGKWIAHKKLSSTSIDSSPYADKYEESTDEFTEKYEEITISKIKVFVKGKDGKLYELDWKAGDATDSLDWIDNGIPDPDKKVEVTSRPFAVTYSNPKKKNYANVFVKGSDDALWEFNTEKIKWYPRGFPGEEIKVSSHPNGCVLEQYKNKHIFVRGSDDCLWERDDSGWKSHQSPANSKLVFSPFFLKKKGSSFHIFSASDKNSIIDRIDDKKIWNEYKDPSETALTPALSWEYWNAKGWAAITGIIDETTNLLRSGKIIFDLPEDIEETEVAGQKSYWIRARIVGGDYGKETFTLTEKINTDTKENEQKVISTKNSIRPPIVNKLFISYELEASQYPQQSWTYNNLEYLDQTDAIRIEDKFFSPFVQLDDKEKTIYLGFEKYFKGGPINIFFAAKELPFTEEKKPKLEWMYSVKNNWNELKGCLDYTEGLIKSDILELIGPLDFSARSRFGSYLFWIKGSLAKGEFEEPPLLDGIYPNTAWALQAGTIKDEILGSGDGKENQRFSFLKFPVLEGEEIRVCEILSEEERQEIITSLGKDAIKETKNEKGKVIETWVLWTEIPDFFDSKPKDRHYTLDRAKGELQFGNDVNGMIPPVKDNNIKAFSYQSGGSKQGNVKAGEIKTLKSAVAGVDKVSNPAAADGGADTATLDEMMEIGPARISHRDRAVTPQDFEWLARQASRKVVKVKCLPNTNNKGLKETGWVTVIIVPESTEAMPCPSIELRKKVRQDLEAHSANTLASKKHINVGSPSYVEISVSVDVFVTSIDKASQAERDVKKELDAFFHPLTGGPEGKGWDFGRDVSASDIYALLEKIDGVDHVENLKFSHKYMSCFDLPQDTKSKVIDVNTRNENEGLVEVLEDHLVANGIHVINLRPKEGDPYGSA
ncbi:MAG TPA: putative baseplate assembly protein [Candidatus Limnocylindrales bacterium]|nr:putative baseplate assembly protein [Candidatus Limnocylindrales bacterium]